MRLFILSGLFLFLLISDFLQNFGIPMPAGSRHILIFIFVSFLYIISIDRKLNLPYVLCFISLILISLISFIYNEVSLLSFSISIFITFLFAYCFVLISGSNFSKLEVNKLSLFIMISIILCGLPGVINFLVSSTPIRLNPGLFREAGAFATAHVIAGIIALALHIKTNKQKFFYLAIFITFILILAGLKKSIGSIILCWLIWTYFRKIKFYKFIGFAGIIAILLSPIYLQVFITDIQKNLDYFNNVGADGHIRIAMYLGSISILSDNLFFGTGLGTFGSLGSLIVGFEWPGRIIYGFSPVYYQYGLIGLAGVNEASINNGTGTTYLDTYWPHILAELGILGLIPFLLLWFYPFYAGTRIYIKNNTNNEYLNSCAFILITICLVLTWEGLFLILPEVPVFIFLHAIYTGAIFSSAKFDLNDLLKK